ncbi:hypothetical protein LTR08_001798 [Meristemomyces frigidus]|nr:hypothetical protein LTR08_001798 [Meristemomyces frigidus]
MGTPSRRRRMPAPSSATAPSKPTTRLPSLSIGVHAGKHSQSPLPLSTALPLCLAPGGTAAPSPSEITLANLPSEHTAAPSSLEVSLKLTTTTALATWGEKSLARSTLRHGLTNSPVSPGFANSPVSPVFTKSPVSPGFTNSPVSPRRAGSVFDSEDGGYKTPMTSPESSPPSKTKPITCSFSHSKAALPQLDGEHGSVAGRLSDGEADEPSGTGGFSMSPSRQRLPSALLTHCERSASPRQRRLMSGGLRTPDRFITSRSATPSKEALLIARPAEKLSPFLKRSHLPTAESDPFAPAPRRSIRMAEQHATLRGPPAIPRSVGIGGTLVSDARPERAVSDGAVWHVGGTLVTEGVASTTNGRGGRITSGTCAPHYTADFLRKASVTEDEAKHGRRLALAMEIDQNAKVLEFGSPSSNSPSSSASSPSSSDRVWRDSAWERNGPVSPTKPLPKKAKEIPTIPFRVLDAPALRDDYYCSLLAYSATVSCLAVGLGPHVYLWSETRGIAHTNIPDSLTAPFASHVTSISFSSTEGGCAILAIGRADGRITLWSPLDRDPRFDSEQPAPVSCACFRPTPVRRQSVRESCMTVTTEELLVGDEVGNVYFYSVEWPNQEQRDLFDWHGSMTLIARVSCHSQQVCGLAWSPDGKTFGSGGNDNQLFLFETKKILKPPIRSRGDSSATVNVRSGSSGSNNTIVGQREVLIVTPGQHKQVFALNAAVKAIAFAPWQPSLLAAGGGSNDRCIHFFHTLSGAALATIDCHAQVTSLIWSSKRREIAATFGFAQPEHPYRVAVFAWPSCRMVVGIPWWSKERALYAVAYPRGPSGGLDAPGDGGRVDAEGRPWYGRRTREEGCLVVATSDASIKFHEVWAERSPDLGVLGGSILEGECSFEGVIR